MAITNHLVQEVPLNYLADVESEYHIGTKLGSGAHGIVYAATRKADGAPMAAKFIPRRKVRRWASNHGSRCPMEVELMEDSDFIQGVARCYDWFDLRVGFLIIMERPNISTSLYHHVNSIGPLGESESRHLFRQVVETALGLSKWGCFHGDIQENNIVLDLATGRTLLVDFGCAQRIRGRPIKDASGAREYLPPEYFLNGEFVADEGTVWSLGCLLFGITQADLAYPDVHNLDVQELRFGYNSSTNLRNLVHDCLALNPSSRIRLQDILDHPWFTQEGEDNDPQEQGEPDGGHESDDGYSTGH